jgi:hypothetical protein
VFCLNSFAKNIPSKAVKFRLLQGPINHFEDVPESVIPICKESIGREFYDSRRRQYLNR